MEIYIFSFLILKLWNNGFALDNCAIKVKDKRIGQIAWFPVRRDLVVYDWVEDIILDWLAWWNAFV